MADETPLPGSLAQQLLGELAATPPGAHPVTQAMSAAAVPGGFVPGSADLAAAPSPSAPQPTMATQAMPTPAGAPPLAAPFAGEASGASRASMAGSDGKSLSSLTSGAGVLATILAGESFWPAEPRSLHEAGLTEPFVETLVCKLLLATGTLSGRAIAERLALPFGLIEPVYGGLRSRKVLTYNGSAPLGDYNYMLTEQGQSLARSYRQACAYVGPAPVPLGDYVLSVEAQAIGDVPVRQDDLAEALADVSVEPELFDLLGPAVNNGCGMFLYGAPGNGKSTLAERMCGCYGQTIWIPRAILEDGEIIKFYDPAFHETPSTSGSSRDETADARWMRVRRPTVIVGGELTMDALDLRHDLRAGVSTASLQMKSNCGCLLIDDFGRQRMAPAELLNRWIVPLESRRDFLTLATGKKIEVPFEQLILFSTNLDPSDLVDEAFLRRIPYKIEIADPDEAEFHRLFEMACEQVDCRYEPETIERLLADHYRPYGRPLRRCHPRDLMKQLVSYCDYHDRPLELQPAFFDRIVASYFTKVKAEPADDRRHEPAPSLAGASPSSASLPQPPAFS